MWRLYIESCPDYWTSRHFVSRECFDILDFLVNGLIGLIIIHRDYYPTVPLLPWLHSSEASSAKNDLVMLHSVVIINLVAWFEPATSRHSATGATSTFMHDRTPPPLYDPARLPAYEPWPPDTQTSSSSPAPLLWPATPPSPSLSELEVMTLGHRIAPLLRLPVNSTVDHRLIMLKGTYLTQPLHNGPGLWVMIRRVCTGWGGFVLEID
ncbi:hypothetical protein GGX14DRAFT_409126 [Mycena pura]|uniref:Uncharacterized protein n=1 Tax=Mycena pura TaxID=153505 RepID=A0AAD6UMW2_9AGAR|nr:hypothetical protein GGX14DRAFT_409126 [Mycena pura]